MAIQNPVWTEETIIGEQSATQWGLAPWGDAPWGDGGVSIWLEES